MISSAVKDQLRVMIDAARDALLNDPALDDRDGEDLVTTGVQRTFAGLRNTGLVVATPCSPSRPMTQETYDAVSRGLAFDHGVLPISIQSFEVTNNREKLVEAAIRSGFRKLLFLDADTVCDWKGVAQLLETMRQQGAALVAALVFQRYIGNEGIFNAFVETGEEEPKHAALTRKDMPTTLTAFPVAYCGLACALIDLDQVKTVEAPWFKRVAHGNRHYGEDVHFCLRLREHDLGVFVDPKVATVHCVPHRFQYEPMIVQE